MTENHHMTGRRGCTAHNRSGEPCGGTPIPGATVCYWHGGAAPQVQRSARLRLLEAVNPALDELFKLIADPDTKDADKIRAIENILDRGGLGRQVTIERDSVFELLTERLIALRTQKLMGDRDQIITGEATAADLSDERGFQVQPDTPKALGRSQDDTADDGQG